MLFSHFYIFTQTQTKYISDLKNTPTEATHYTFPSGEWSKSC